MAKGVLPGPVLTLKVPCPDHMTGGDGRFRVWFNVIGFQLELDGGPGQRGSPPTEQPGAGAPGKLKKYNLEENVHHDMEQYLSTVAIGSMSSMEVNVDMLEQMDLMDMSDHEAMDVFLLSGGEENSATSPVMGPDMGCFTTEISLKVPTQAELLHKLSSLSPDTDTQATEPGEGEGEEEEEGEEGEEGEVEDTLGGGAGGPRRRAVKGVPARRGRRRREWLLVGKTEEDGSSGLFLFRERETHTHTHRMNVILHIRPHSSFLHHVTVILMIPPMCCCIATQR
ncbi:hypothetical protein NHX12_023097 [Muraenolepis orangiensis]|uniref:Uncharacterized protein n=1 Tax=Muraenolepis orangiensis TaxID=630683 RepID=A0A9Q0EMG6_9TELE|nr:hypothetical protein NHX12_023097 [Muraenolepis orangiensis]